MSLVEKMERALCASNGQEWDRLPNTLADALASIKNGGTAYCKDDYRAEARAAIKAVAEWLQESEDFYSNIIGIKLERQLKEPQ